MSQIVRFFLLGMLVFCPTIGIVYADQQQIVLPSIVIDLSSIATHIFHQQAMLFLFFSIGAVFLLFFAYVLLDRQREKSISNHGDIQARSVLLVWLIFLFLLVVGLALPTLRVVLSIIK
mgnify:CR=1 FL=1